jgi:hypothetical protein
MKLSLSNLLAGFRSSNKLNVNFQAITDAFDNTLSRDGSAPNAMLAPLDMNSNRIINLGAPVNQTDAVRVQDITENSSLVTPTTWVDTLVQLRAQTWSGGRPGVVLVAKNWTTGDGGGTYTWDATSVLADNSGTVIKEAATPIGRWLRQKETNRVSAKAFALPPYGTNAQPALQQALAATDMGGITLPDQQIFNGATVTSSNPVSVQGVGTGSGPGTAAQANSRVTQIVGNTNSWAFEIDSVYPSYFEGMQFNQDPSARPQTSGGGIRFTTSQVGGATTANHIVDKIGSTNKNIGMEFHRPCNPQVRGFYADNWNTAALRYTTDTVNEGLGGLILHPFLFGNSGSTTQGGAITSQIGYQTIIAPIIIGASYGIDWSVTNYPAGRFAVFNGSIENQGIAGVRARRVSADGSMFMIQGTEFSNVDFTTGYISDILIEDSAAPWLDTFSLIGNIHRHSLVGSGYICYDIRSGTGGVIKGAIVNILSATGGGVDHRIVKVGTQASKVYVDNPLIVGTIPPAPYELNATTTLFDVVNGITVAMLPNAKDGSIVWCSNAVPGGSTAVAGGTGALLIRQSGAWRPIVSSSSVRSDSSSVQAKFTIQNADITGFGSKLSFEQGTGIEVHSLVSEFASGDWRFRHKYNGATLFEVASNGMPTFRPPASSTPVNNGDVSFQLTSNTQLTFKAKGSDGVVRSGSLTLA